MKLSYCVSILPYGLITARELRRTVVQDVVSLLPPCAVSCTLPVVLKYGCDAGNFTSLSRCLCPNNNAERNIANCIYSNCTYSEQLQAADSQQLLCDGLPQESRQPAILATAISTAVAVAIFASLRCWSRYAISREFWWDDWLLIASATLYITLQVITIWGVSIGFGKHIWNTSSGDINHLYILLYIYEIFYVVVQTVAKLSILMLYYRIFPQEWLHQTVIVLSIGMICHGIGFLIPVLFACRPVALIYDKTLQGTCHDAHLVTVVGAWFSIVEDLIFISLPVPSILKLRLTPRKKFSVLFTLCLGIVACIASMVRVKFAFQFKYSPDQQWENFGISITSMIELSLSIICVCFPAVKLLLNRRLPKIFGTQDTKKAGPSITQNSRESRRKKWAWLRKTWNKGRDTKNIQYDGEFRTPSIDDDAKRILPTIRHLTEIELEESREHSETGHGQNMGRRKSEITNV